MLDRAFLVARLPPRTHSAPAVLFCFRPNLHQFNKHFNRLHHLVQAGEFQRRVDVMLPGREIRRWQAQFRQTGSIGAAPDNICRDIAIQTLKRSFCELDGSRLFREAFTQVSVLLLYGCLLYTSPSPRDRQKSRMPSSA